MHSTEALQVSQDTPVSPITPEISEMSTSSSQLLSTNLSPPGESAESTLPPVSSPYSVRSKSSDLDGKSPASIASSFASPSGQGHSFH